MDLDNGYYCNGAYGGPSNIRVAAETRFVAKECRFHFFAAGVIAAGYDILYNYRSFVISSGWAEFGL